MSAGAYDISARTKPKGKVDYGAFAYDEQRVHAILDEGLIAHVAFDRPDGFPSCLPMAYARLDKTLYLHGSITNSMLKTTTKGGLDICVTVTLLDGIVVARSAFHHTMDYRCVVAYGKARPVTDPEEKDKALNAMTDHILPGRTKEIRPNSKNEKSATLVLALDLLEVSAKISDEWPKDDKKDYESKDVWAGKLPFVPWATASPIDDPQLFPGTPAPPSVTGYKRKGI